MASCMKGSRERFVEIGYAAPQRMCRANETDLHVDQINIYKEPATRRGLNLGIKLYSFGNKVFIAVGRSTRYKLGKKSGKEQLGAENDR